MSFKATSLRLAGTSSRAFTIQKATIAYASIATHVVEGHNHGSCTCALQGNRHGLPIGRAYGMPADEYSRFSLDPASLCEADRNETLFLLNVRGSGELAARGSRASIEGTPAGRILRDYVDHLIRQRIDFFTRQSESWMLTPGL